jgi:hypothetical protein
MNSCPPLSAREASLLEARPEDLGFLRQWFSSLKSGKVKDSIQIVRYFPSESRNADAVVVFCRHPFTNESLAVQTAQASRAVPELNRALSSLIGIFWDWIEHEGVNTQPCSFDRSIAVYWWPIEMMLNVAPSSAPQIQAQAKLNDHTLDCLELIRFATMKKQAFAQGWQQSNEPFLAAGRIAYGQFKWIRTFPNFSTLAPRVRKETKIRIKKFAREYMGLFQMARTFSHISPLTNKLLGVVTSFRRKFIQQIPEWSTLAGRYLDFDEKPEDLLPIVGSNAYESIDHAADYLRYALVEASTDLEHHIPAMVNSFLPLLQVPESAIYFSDKRCRTLGCETGGQ